MITLVWLVRRLCQPQQTVCLALILTGKKQPGVTNLLKIQSLLSGRSQDDINAEWVGCERYGDLKTSVADTVEEFLTNFHLKYKSITDEELIYKLEKSEEKMRKIAGETLLRVQKAVGLR